MFNKHNVDTWTQCTGQWFRTGNENGNGNSGCTTWSNCLTMELQVVFLCMQLYQLVNSDFRSMQYMICTDILERCSRAIRRFILSEHKWLLSLYYFARRDMQTIKTFFRSVSDHVIRKNVWILKYDHLKQLQERNNEKSFSWPKYCTPFVECKS